jgi:phosphoglycolate phosphatase-like HAD superfamily hydrolase
MQSGELTSVLYIARGNGGRDEIGVAGDFVNDMAAAERAAVAGFAAMFGRPIGTSRPLPRDLKKETRCVDY